MWFYEQKNPGDLQFPGFFVLTPREILPYVVIRQLGPLQLSFMCRLYYGWR
jgi:hypothetical protein